MFIKLRPKQTQWRTGRHGLREGTAAAPAAATDNTGEQKGQWPGNLKGVVMA